MKRFFSMPEGRLRDSSMRCQPYQCFGDDLVSSNCSLSAVTMPNMEDVKRQRNLRTQRAMEAVNPFLAKKMIFKGRGLSKEEKAAIDIQRIFRGFLGRQEYRNRLCEKIIEEEAEMEARQRAQVEEGELLIHSYRLEREVDDISAIRRNRGRSDAAHAITIQRAWRAHHRKKNSEDVTEEYEPILFGQAEFGYDDEEFPVSSYNFICRTGQFSLNSEFDDSLEDSTSVYEHDLHDVSGHLSSQYFDDGVSETTFTGHLVREGIRNLKFEREDSTCSSTQESLPSPTTDWNTIESVLQTESGINSPEDGTDGEEGDIVSKLNRTGPALQMCFVDDNDSSITDTDSDPEVKVYVVDEEHSLNYLDKAHTVGDISGTSVNLLHELDRDLDSRDSGYVPGDLVDLNIERVTDLNPRRMKSATPPEEESTRVLTALEMHGKQEERLKEKDILKRKMVRDLEMKTLRDLLSLKVDLENKIQEISDQLVRELMTRDTLHAEQDSLVMDVEDLTKLAQERQKVNGFSEQPKTKIK